LTLYCLSSDYPFVIVLSCLLITLLTLYCLSSDYPFDIVLSCLLITLLTLYCLSSDYPFDIVFSVFWLPFWHCIFCLLITLLVSSNFSLFFFFCSTTFHLFILKTILKCSKINTCINIVSAFNRALSIINQTLSIKFRWLWLN
jgi:hypothetical protein